MLRKTAPPYTSVGGVGNKIISFSKNILNMHENLIKCKMTLKHRPSISKTAAKI